MAEVRPIDRSCEVFHPGHEVHWIQVKKSIELGQPVIGVSSIVVHDDGLVDITGKDLELTLWNHDPERLRDALNSYRRCILWKPRFHVLAVPGPSGGVFNMAQLDERRPCRQGIRPRPGEPVDDFLLRVLREDGGFMLPASSLLPPDVAEGSGESGREVGGT